MRRNLSQSGIPQDTDRESRISGTLIAFLLIAVLVLVAVILHRHNVASEEFENVNKFLQESIPSEYFGENSPLIAFSYEDVETTTGWKILSGVYPTVTFRCRLAPGVGSRLVVLCYRPLDSEHWQTVDARVRRDHTAKITLRDLRRDTAYECFFVCEWQGKTLKSQKVVIWNGTTP